METTTKIFASESAAELQARYKDSSTDELLNVIASLHSTVENLKQMLFQKSERRREDPVGIEALFNEVEVASQDVVDEEAPLFDPPTPDTKNPDTVKKRGKRKPLPSNLPRERVEHDLSEAEKICPKHQTPLMRIGEKTTEQLDVVPATMKVIENVTFSYKCPCCAKDDHATGENIINSVMEPQPIPKSMATPNLLAYLTTAKYQDGLPLYRQEKIFDRYGVDLGRTTMARWMIQSSVLAQPLINMMNEDLLERKVIGCDETPLQVLDEPNRSPQQQSYMWVTFSQEGAPIILFHYYENRSAKVASELLSQFSGAIVCDGLKSYDSFAANHSATLAGCMAHIRRKFFIAEKAAKKADPQSSPKAKIPLDLIKALYKIEKTIKGEPPDKVFEVRQKESKTHMEKLKSFLDDQKTKVLPKSLIGKAINYALDQWTKMLVFLESPLVPIDNNGTERCIRPFVIGRNNWTFSQTPAGAHASANLYSLIESAKANGIEPFGYLSLIFKELPKVQDADGYTKLLPHVVKNHFDLKPYQLPR
jgi:transposase